MADITNNQINKDKEIMTSNSKKTLDKISDNINNNNNISNTINIKNIIINKSKNIAEPNIPNIKPKKRIIEMIITFLYLIFGLCLFGHSFHFLFSDYVS